MARAEETNPLEEAINELESELFVCVRDFHGITVDPEKTVIHLKTVEEFAKQITSNHEYLADFNIFSNVSVLVKQLLESEMVIFDVSEEEQIFEILKSIKELIDIMRDNIRKL